MAQQFSEISSGITEFIQKQKVFFIGTADDDGRVNISPKGSDSIRVLGSKRVVWMNLTGSGNESAAHMMANNRITIMFCSFEEKPMILRLYGSGKIVHAGNAEWDELSKLFPDKIGARQFFDIAVDQVQTSCGFQVPYYDYVGERDMLDKWTERRGRAGIEQYWDERNRRSIDGKATGI